MARRGGSPRIVIGADSSAVGRETKQAAGQLEQFKAKASHSLTGTAKSAAGTAVGLLGLSGAVYGVKEALVGSVQAANESEKSQAKLRAQLKASGVSWRAHAGEIDNVIQRVSKLAGLDDEDLQDAFVNVYRASGTLNGSLKEMGLVADIARAKHMDVAKAGVLVGKVMDGNVGALTRYGISVKPVTAAQDHLRDSVKNATVEQQRAAKEADKQATAQKGLGLLQEKFAGQAKAYGQTTSGSVDRLGVAFENLQETVGGAVAPALGKAANNLADFITGMQDGKGAGGRFADTLDDIWQKAKPVVNFLKDHPKLIAGAIGAWVAYKAAAKLASVAFKVSQFKANLAKTVPVAAEEGAVAGRAYASSFEATSMAGVGKISKGGKFRAAASGFGLAFGVIAAAGVVKSIDDAVRDLAPDPVKKQTNGHIGTFNVTSNIVGGLGLGTKGQTERNNNPNNSDGTKVGKGGAGLSKPGAGLGGLPGTHGHTSSVRAHTSMVAPHDPGSQRRSGSAAGGAARTSNTTYSHAQLAGLWVKAGGDPSVADVAAAVAQAESGGRTHAPSSNPAGGSNVGLWQIWSGHPDATEDPLGNARAAVRIYNAAGGTFARDWEAYTNGSYRQFLTGSNATSGVSVGSVAATPTAPTKLDRLTANADLAALTKGKGDDRKAAGSLVSYWTGRLKAAKAKGNQTAISTAAQGLKEARDTASGLKPQRATIQDQWDIESANADIAEANGHTDVATFVRVVSLRKQVAAINKKLRKKGLTPAQKAALKAQKASALQGINAAQTGYTDSVATSAPDVGLPSGIGAQISLAALTPDNADDIAGYTQAQTFYAGQLSDAQAKGDNEGVIAAADALKGIQDTLSELQGVAEDQLATMQQQRDLEKQRGDDMARAFAVSQAQYPAFVTAMAAEFNASIGRSVGGPRPGRLAPGSVGRL